MPCRRPPFLFKLMWKWSCHFHNEIPAIPKKNKTLYPVSLKAFGCDGHVTHRASRMASFCHRLPCAAGSKAGSSNGPSGRDSKISDNRSTSSNVAIVHFLYRHNRRFFHLRFCQKPQQKPSAVESFGGSLLRHVSHSLCPHLCLEFVSAASCSNLIIKKRI